MIPVKLTFQAFGPYVKRQEIDFRKFADSGVFLIHGATGSGKTTILDAMTGVQTCALPIWKIKRRPARRHYRNEMPDGKGRYSYRS